MEAFSSISSFALRSFKQRISSVGVLGREWGGREWNSLGVGGAYISTPGLDFLSSIMDKLFTSSCLGSLGRIICT